MNRSFRLLVLTSVMILGLFATSSVTMADPHRGLATPVHLSYKQDVFITELYQRGNTLTIQTGRIHGVFEEMSDSDIVSSFSAFLPADVDHAMSL